MTLLRDEAVVEAYRAAMEPAFPHGVAIAGRRGLRARPHVPSTPNWTSCCLPIRQSNPKHSRRSCPNSSACFGTRAASQLHGAHRCRMPGRSGARERARASACLDRRLLAGDRALYRATRSRNCRPRWHIHREKMRQRLCQSARARHAAHGNTPCHAEPDVKEGPGGLQDVRVLDWLALLKAENEARSGDTGPGRGLRLLDALLSPLPRRRRPQRTRFRGAGEPGAAEIRPRHAPSTSGARAPFSTQARRAVDEAEKSESSLLENFREYRSRLSNQEFTVSRERLLLRNPAQSADDPRWSCACSNSSAATAFPHRRRRSEGSNRRGNRSRHGAPSRGRCGAASKITLASPHAAMALRTLQSTGLMRALAARVGRHRRPGNRRLGIPLYGGRTYPADGGSRSRTGPGGQSGTPAIRGAARRKSTMWRC